MAGMELATAAGTAMAGRMPVGTVADIGMAADGSARLTTLPGRVEVATCRRAVVSTVAAFPRPTVAA